MFGTTINDIEFEILTHALKHAVWLANKNVSKSFWLVKREILTEPSKDNIKVNPLLLHPPEKNRLNQSEIVKIPDQLKIYTIFLISEFYDIFRNVWKWMLLEMW